VLVLSPFGGGSRMPLEWGMDLATQVDELRARGSRVETVFPDGGAGDVFDANALDPSTRLQAARGGDDQGRALAELLAEIWRVAHISSGIGRLSGSGFRIPTNGSRWISPTSRTTGRATLRSQPNQNKKSSHA
jgi:hypothetical protein